MNLNNDFHSEIELMAEAVYNEVIAAAKERMCTSHLAVKEDVVKPLVTHLFDALDDYKKAVVYAHVFFYDPETQDPSVPNVKDLDDFAKMTLTTTLIDELS